jgi:DNA (cytosine-5)-methyltransferase 1
MLDERPTHIDLFSGIGGFALAAERVGWATRLFVEKNEFCQRLLRQHWKEVPIISDIKEFDATGHRGVSLLTGGFPCQPFSVGNNNKRQGKNDDRYLWPEMLRVIEESRPQFIVAENVTGIIEMALDTVLSDLESCDYTAGTFIIPACGINAPHRRNRVWIVANANEQGPQGLRGLNPKRERGGEVPVRESGWSIEGTWEFEPDICRVAHGVSKRVDRLTALGNAIVPGIAEEILRSLVRSYEARR